MTDNINIRPICASDREHGFFDILSQLTIAPTLSKEEFETILNHQDRHGLRLTVVAVDSSQNDKICATGSAIIEWKFIRGGKPCGHIEDIVVDKTCRGHQLGKRIVLHLIEYCIERGCYKVILDCSSDKIPFYEKCGFEVKGTQMSKYLI